MRPPFFMTEVDVSYACTWDGVLGLILVLDHSEAHVAQGPVIRDGRKLWFPHSPMLLSGPKGHPYPNLPVSACPARPSSY